MRDSIIGFIVAGIVLVFCYFMIEFLGGSHLASQELPPGLSNDDLVKMIEDRETKEDDRVAALIRLGDATEDLDIIVPLLCRWNSYKSVYRQATIMSLKKIGEPAVEHLEQFFSSKVKLNAYEQIENLKEVRSDRVAACIGVNALGDQCIDYLPHIKTLLADEAVSLRRCGLYALEGMEIGAEKLLDDVIKCLEDGDFNNQLSACRIIRNLGPKANRAEVVLQKIFKSGIPSVRGYAAIALGAIGPSPSKEDNAELIAAGLEKAPPAIKSRILKGLALMGESAKHVAPIVRDQLENWDRDVQANAALTLWKIDNDKALALRTINGLLTTAGYEQDGLLAVEQMGSDAISLIGSVTAKAKSPEPITRELVVSAIASMGESAKTAGLSVLKTLSKDSDPIVRKTARDAIAQLTKE